MRAFDLATGEPKACFPAAGDTLTGVHFHPSLPLLATGSGGPRAAGTRAGSVGWARLWTAAEHLRSTQALQPACLPQHACPACSCSGMPFHGGVMRRAPALPSGAV